MVPVHVPLGDTLHAINLDLGGVMTCDGVGYLFHRHLVHLGCMDDEPAGRV